MTVNEFKNWCKPSILIVIRDIDSERWHWQQHAFKEVVLNDENIKEYEDEEIVDIGITMKDSVVCILVNLYNG